MSRFVWSVNILDVQPDDNILEIGCGHGIAAELVAGRLGDGKLTAMDKSSTMIAKAQQRNSLFVEQGTVQFHIAELSEAELPLNAFNKIFAINVNVFWLKPDDELAVIYRALRPDGLLCLFYEPPAADKVQRMTENLIKNLNAARFTWVDTMLEDSESDCLLGVIARK